MSPETLAFLLKRSQMLDDYDEGILDPVQYLPVLDQLACPGIIDVPASTMDDGPCTPLTQTQQQGDTLDYSACLPDKLHRSPSVNSSASSTPRFRLATTALTLRPKMASGQYNYPPPPPPPPQGGLNGYQQYQSSGYGPPRGGGGGSGPRGRGRGGSHMQGGRGDFHASSPYNQHAGGYNSHAPVGNGYGPQNPAPYIGPQAPAPPATSSYPPPSWGEQPQPQHPQQQHPVHVQLHHQPAPPPVPLSAQNYHPNYAPQVYQQPQPGQQQQPQPPQQYGPQQPFQPQHGYGQHVPMSQLPNSSGPPPQQWQGPPHHSTAPFNGGARGRGRGSNHSQGRGGFDAPLMGPPIRMGFDGERPGEPMHQASNGYPPPYAIPQHNSPPIPPFSQPAHQGYPPPQNFHNRPQRPPLDANPFHSHGNNSRGGGRGGHFNNRDRGGKRDTFSNDKNRRQNMKNRDSNGSSAHHNTQRPAIAESVKSGDGKKKKKKKRRTNTLGLTPANEEHEESEEEDDADEESRLIADISSDIPKEPSDLDAWLAERRNRWPTKARREAKAVEIVERRSKAAEQSARDKAKAKKDREERDSKDSKSAGESKLDKQKRKAEKLRKQLERAEQKVQDAMKAGMKRKRDDHDIGDDIVDQVIAKVTGALDSDSDSDDSSEYTSATDSDDGEPEAQTSRHNGPVRVSQPARKPILERQCKYFSTGGTCGKKGKCRFVHDQSVRDAALRDKELNGGRMTLAQRLVQNDKEKDDLTVVKSIKYLFDKGGLDEPGGSSAYSNGQNGNNGFPQETQDEDHQMQGYSSQGDYQNQYMDSEV